MLLLVLTDIQFLLVSKKIILLYSEVVSGSPSDLPAFTFTSLAASLIACSSDVPSVGWSAM